MWLYVAIGVGGLGLIASLWYFRSFLHDYGYDALLSFADEAFGGVVGIDFGDFIAAILMYRGERNRIGVLPALFVAWEASNFFPLGLIPFLGTGLEYVLNVFPAATLFNVLFNKESKATKARRRVDEFNEVCDAFDISVDKSDAKQAFDDGDWVEAANSYQAILQTTKSKVEQAVYEKAREVDQESRNLLNQVSGEDSDRARRLRRTTPRIDDYTEKAREEVERREYEEAAADVLTAERLLERLQR